MSHLPYSGIASFARSPLVEIAGQWQADCAVLGVPFDLALGYRPGARYAPRALREASLRYVPPLVDFTGKVYLGDVTFVDAGDVVLPTLEPQLARTRITQAAQAIRKRCKLPLFLGGDHSVTYPLLCAFAEVPDLYVVQLDAHLDFTDTRNDTQFSNSSPFRRAVEALPNLVHITTIGLRGLRFDLEALQAARARGHTLVPASEVQSSFAEALQRLPKGQSVYLSVDADVLDPAVIPGTSSPEPEGLTYQQAADLLKYIASHNQVMGLDLVELAPNLDPTGRSSLTCARLIMDTLCEVFSE